MVQGFCIVLFQGYDIQKNDELILHVNIPKPLPLIHAPQRRGRAESAKEESRHELAVGKASSEMYVAKVPRVVQ